jgi:ribosomal protein S18 acetylase RimI-like enzyme
MALQHNTPSVLIRPACLADAASLNTMCWPERSHESVFELLRRTHKLAQNERGLGAVATWDNAPCGFGMLTLWPRAAEISDLIVNARYRGQGVGSLIIDYLTNAARDMRVQVLEIGVALSNPRALALYRRLGFIDGRTIELELGNGPEPVLYLYKHLRATR